MATRPYPAVSTLLGASSSPSSTPSVLALLHSLAVTALGYSLETALFYAERLYAIDPSEEPSVYLLATIHFRLDQPHQAAHLLRLAVSFNTASNAATTTQAPPERARHDDDLFGGPCAAAAIDSKPNRPGTATNLASARLSRPAIECSVRCARLYGQVCAKLGRDKEGRHALFRITQPWNEFVPSSSEPLESALVTGAVHVDESTVIDLEMARLARKGGEHERAVSSYSRVLAKLPSCWEALEILCQLGAPPLDLDSLYPARSRPSPVPPHSHAHAHAAAPLNAAQSRSHPPPLGPSLNATINAPFSFGRPRNGDLQETPLNYSTPVEAGQAGFAKLHGAGQALGAGPKGKGRDSWMTGGGLPLRRTASGRYGDITESSFEDQ